MNGYELILIVDGTLRDEDAKSVAVKIQDFLSKQIGAKDLTCEDWGRKKLGYPIKKKESGVYYVIYFNCPTDKIVEIRRKLAFEEFILKNIIFKCEKVEEELDFFRSLMSNPAANSDAYLEIKKGA